MFKKKQNYTENHIHTLAISEFWVSNARSFEYSSERRSQASGVNVGFTALARWMYFFINSMLTTFSL